MTIVPSWWPSTTVFENRRTFGALPSLTAALAWGAMFPIAATALKHVDPFHLTAIRYLVAAAIFLALLTAFEGGRALLPEGRGVELFVLGSLGFAGSTCSRTPRSSTPARRTRH
jgi:drug/metabolite transporter (DMT)-like permease